MGAADVSGVRSRGREQIVGECNSWQSVIDTVGKVWTDESVQNFS